MQKIGEASEKIQWQKIEGNDTAKEFPSYSVKQMFLLDHLLLSFSNTSKEVLVFDMRKLIWEHAMVTGRSLLMEVSQKTQLCAINHTTIATFGGIQESNSTKKVMFESLSVNQEETVNMTWISKPSLIPFRVNHTVESFEDSLYIFGGKGDTGSLLNDLYIYNDNKDSFIKVEPKGIKPTPRENHSSFKLNEQMYIFGGVSGDGNHLSDIWVWDFRDNKEWRKIVPNTATNQGILPFPRKLSLIQGFGDKIFIFKGTPKEGVCEDLLCYDIGTECWEDLSSKQVYPYVGGSQIFAIYDRKFIMGKHFQLYQLDIRPLLEDTSYKELYEQKQFTDITFKVEGQDFAAHKVVLAAKSKYFKNAFESGMKESKDQVRDISHIRSSVFKVILEHLYCDHVDITEEIALGLLELSNEYLLDRLKLRCEYFLMNHMRLESAIEIINVSDICEALKLRKAALGFIIRNITEIAKIKDLSKLRQSVLHDLINRD